MSDVEVNEMVFEIDDNDDEKDIDESDLDVEGLESRTLHL